MAINMIVLFISTIIAFWISAICGGGASLILIPLLNIFLVPQYVPFTMTVGTVASSISRIFIFWKKINRRVTAWFIPFSIPGVISGAWLLKYFNPLYLEIIVAFFLIANIPELFKTREQELGEEMPYPPYVLSIVGFFAGFVSGVTGAIGLIFNRFYLRYGLSKEEIVATRAANEIILHLIKLVVYILLGLYGKLAIMLGLVVATASVLSSYTIKFVLPYLSEYSFRKIGYTSMVISGFVLLFTTATKIIQQDRLAITTNEYKETVVNWRNNSFVLEFSISEGLEIERQLRVEEIPSSLKEMYDNLLKHYDEILVERIYRFWLGRSYELYCYKHGKLIKKIEVEEDY